jgi:DNA-binding LacI/PurR family transcriptional regulator
MVNELVENGVTIAELARKCGVEYLTAWRWHNQGQKPQPKTREKIEAYYRSLKAKGHLK